MGDTGSGGIAGSDRDTVDGHLYRPQTGEGGLVGGDVLNLKVM